MAFYELFMGFLLYELFLLSVAAPLFWTTFIHIDDFATFNARPSWIFQ